MKAGLRICRRRQGQHKAAVSKQAHASACESLLSHFDCSLDMAVLLSVTGDPCKKARSKTLLGPWPRLPKLLKFAARSLPDPRLIFV